MKELARILVPVDGSAGSDKAVDTAVLLAEASGAAIDLLYVSYFDSGTDDTLGQVSWLPDSVMGSSARASADILERARKRIPDSIQVELHAETGVPARKIVEFSDTHDKELIVVGGRGLGLVEGFLLGSVSQEVMESAKSTVLIVK